MFVPMPQPIARPVLTNFHAQFPDLTSFEQGLSLFSRLRHIPRQTCHAPQLVASDSGSRTIVLRKPDLHWVPLRLRAKDAKLDVSTLLDLKEKLRVCVSLLYSHGVAYKVKPDCVFLVKGSSSWMLYLGGWTDAEVCSERERSQSTEWDSQKAAQLDEVERVFAPLEADADSLCRRQLEDGLQTTTGVVAAINTLGL